MPLFLEPSAWARLYVQEEGTEAMKQLFARPDLREDGFFASVAVSLEMYGRLAKSLRIGEDEISKRIQEGSDRRHRKTEAKRLRKRNLLKYRTAVAEFERDVEGVAEVELTNETYERAILLSAAAPERAVSGMDWLHLATVLLFSERLRKLDLPHNVILVTADGPLIRAAKGRGMEVFNPCTDDPSRIPPPRLL